MSKSKADRQLAIAIERRGDVIILSVTGELDMATAPLLRESVLMALENDPGTLVLDLTAVTFLGSAGMSQLLEAEGLGGGRTVVRVVASGRECLRPIRLTSLDAVLPVHPTVAEALG